MRQSKEKEQLSVSLAEALGSYMQDLNGQPCTRLYQTTMETIEKQLVVFSLQKNEGNLSAAAKMLGISRTTLARKIAAHGLQKCAYSTR